MATPRPTDSHDVLIIKDLEVFSLIGVYEWEHQQKQKLSITVKLEIPVIDAAAQHDDLSHTLDSVAICDRIIHVAGERPRKLVETLAKDIVNDLFGSFSILAATVEVKKFLRKDARYVSLRIKRSI